MLTTTQRVGGDVGDGGPCVLASVFHVGGLYRPGWGGVLWPVAEYCEEWAQDRIDRLGQDPWKWRWKRSWAPGMLWKRSWWMPGAVGTLDFPPQALRPYIRYDPQYVAELVHAAEQYILAGADLDPSILDHPSWLAYQRSVVHVPLQSASGTPAEEAFYGRLGIFASEGERAACINYIVDVAYSNAKALKATGMTVGLVAA